MDKIGNMDTVCTTEEQPSMVRKIGNTTFDVYVHYSKTSKETLTDKVIRLIRNDINANNLS